MTDSIFEKFKVFIEKKSTIILIVLASVWMILAAFVAIIPDSFTKSGGDWEFLKNVISWLEKAVIPSGLLLLLVSTLVPGKTDYAIDNLSKKIDALTSDSVGFHFFSNVNDFFGDLIKRSIEDPKITKSLVSRIRLEDDQNFDQHPNVRAYYERIVDRCENDPNFELTRIIAAQNKRALQPICDNWFTAIRHGNPRFKLKVLDKNVGHSFINLAILVSESGTECVYVVLSPTNATVKAVRITNDSEVLKAFTDYYHMMSNSPGIIELDHDNYLQKLR